MEERVLLGVKLLDQKRPRWREQIDLRSLDMRDGRRCIIGQLYGEFFKGLGELDILGRGWLHGFVLPEDREEWVKAIGNTPTNLIKRLWLRWRKA